MKNTRCEKCEGEGRLYRAAQGGNDPDSVDMGECQECHGLGVIPVDEWQPIETAPKDGTHILVCSARKPYGAYWTFDQAPPTVVHYFNDPDEPGFYTSVNELAPEHPFNPTHWQALPVPPVT